jgi:hypothetical protein
MLGLAIEWWAIGWVRHEILPAGGAADLRNLPAGGAAGLH